MSETVYVVFFEIIVPITLIILLIESIRMNRRRIKSNEKVNESVDKLILETMENTRQFQEVDKALEYITPYLKGRN